MKLIFLHIPKAGGTTLESILIKRQRKGVVLRLGKAVPPEQFCQWPEVRRESVGLLIGHVPFGIHAFMGSEDIRYLTIFRDPIARTISHYYYIKRHPTHWLHGKVTRDLMSLRDFALSNLTSQLDNGQVRLLAGCEDMRLKVSDAMVEQAIDNIQGWFAGFGILERFDESLLVLRDALSWQDMPVYRVRNVGHDKPEASPQDRDAIGERNRFDQALYTWAQEEFSRQLDRLVDVDRELQILKTANEAYNRGYGEGRAEERRIISTRSPIRRVQRKLRSLLS